MAQLTTEGLPPAMLLDLDDTILDDSGGVEVCWRASCELYADRLGVGATALHAAIEDRRTWFWADPARHEQGRRDLRAASAHIVGLALAQFDVVAPELARAVAEHYRDQRDAYIAPFPGALATLEALQSAGVRLALITNGSAAAQRGKVDRFDLARYFDCILIEGSRESVSPMSASTARPSPPSKAGLSRPGAWVTI